MFGNLGTGNTETSSFGAFGQNSAASASAFSLGVPRPAIGFGAFGGNAFAFGGTPSMTGAPGRHVFAFTAPSTGNDAFGGSWAFGRPDPTKTFGTGNSAGTSMPAYSATTCKQVRSGKSSVIELVTITAMRAYKGRSLEELRLQDYQWTRKTGSIGTFIAASKQQRPVTSDPSKQELLEKLVRQSLLAEEFVSTQFHVFSAKSASLGQVVKPRVLRANNSFLAKSSKYFLDLLNSNTNPSDPSLVDLTDDDDVPSNARIDDYGYESDSDLDDYDDLLPVASSNAPRSSVTLSKSRSNIGEETQLKDDDEKELSENDSGLVMFLMSLKASKTDDSLFGSDSEAKSAVRSEPAVQGTAGKKSRSAIRLRSLEGRHILVKDTAFQTWYTLLNYLYTDKINFLPLSSATSDQYHKSSTSFLQEPRCSAKSMYRLASKLGLHHLRDEALAYIRSKLTENNILQELSCSLVSRFPQLLEMELDVLHSVIESPCVAENFPAFAQRIANKELAHGADIIVGIHTRSLKKSRRDGKGRKRKRRVDDQ